LGMKPKSSTAISPRRNSGSFEKPEEEEKK
jgi:hypothetical protein